MGFSHASLWLWDNQPFYASAQARPNTSKSLILKLYIGQSCAIQNVGRVLPTRLDTLRSHTFP